MKTIILFPGYGSQFVGMGKELYDESRIMQEYFEEAANCLDVNFVKLCFASSDIELGKMSNAYPALFLIGSSISTMIKEVGITPDAVAGYNSGEYAAVYAAGCFSFPDGLYLLNKFATFYEQALVDMDVELMRVTGLPTAKLQDVCMHSSNGDVYIAVYETADEHIISGNTAAVERVRSALAEHEGVAIGDVGVEVGLHSPLMEPVVVQFKDYLEKVDFKNLAYPFF